MNSSSLSKDGAWLRDQLNAANVKLQSEAHVSAASSKIYVASGGYMISTAYEQLRNAAEYAEEHLLLQRAIRRFYRRNLSFLEKRPARALGEELIIELTQAGYLVNNTIDKKVVAKIDEVITEGYGVYWRVKQHRISRERAANWTLDVLSIQTEDLLSKNPYLEIIASFAYNHYLKTLPKETFFDESVRDYEASLYVAVHRALLKSDMAMVRQALLKLYNQTPKDMTAYVQFNKKIDELFTSPTTEKLVQIINKHGAPLRIIRQLIDNYPNLADTLSNKNKFLSVVDGQIQTEYRDIRRKVNRGVIKSVIFLFITKFIIGLAIEIPYDLYITGSILVLPLVINLLVPPLYMASLRLSLTLPSKANSVALREYIESLMYDSDKQFSYAYARANRGSSPILSLMYGAMFIISFGVVVSLLLLAQFEWVHMVIFFVFISTASFLGFRLSRMIREIEIVTASQGALSLLRDFFYTPFILVGRWLSDKYARVNFITLILDMAIELPLKTFLRLTRQWSRFLNEKKDQI